MQRYKWCKWRKRRNGTKNVRRQNGAAIREKHFQVADCATSSSSDGGRTANRAVAPRGAVSGAVAVRAESETRERERERRRRVAAATAAIARSLAPRRAFIILSHYSSCGSCGEQKEGRKEGCFCTGYWCVSEEQRETGDGDRQTVTLALLLSPACGKKAIRSRSLVHSRQSTESTEALRFVPHRAWRRDIVQQRVVCMRVRSTYSAIIHSVANQRWDRLLDEGSLPGKTKDEWRVVNCNCVKQKLRKLGNGGIPRNFAFIFLLCQRPKLNKR